MRNLMLRIFAAFVAIYCCVIQARAASPLQAFADNICYNLGSEVRLKIEAPAGASLPNSVDVSASIRYAGATKPLLAEIALIKAATKSSANSPPAYHRLWVIPQTARTGRYEIDLMERDVRTRQAILSLPDAASFVVYRKLVGIDAFRLDKTFYTSGDKVSADFALQNLTRTPLTGLRVEFSNRYWPWIAGPADAARASVVTLDQNLSLPAGGTKQIRAPEVETADEVKLPATHQYGVVVWDHARQTVLAIAFSPLAFFHPPGVMDPKPFAGWYVYPTLDTVNTTAYRQFNSSGDESPAIHFDRTHTMFAAGSELNAEFTISNPTTETWKQISIGYHLVGPDGIGLPGDQVMPGPLDLSPGGASGKFQVSYKTSPDANGVYKLQAEVTGPNGNLLASGALELAVNPLPKSILIFCAHEDDEGGYSGLARAAIENNIPIHYVYFTSGDAGSCDDYYQHSCSPAEAFNFGGLRMDEVRASLGHLGIPRDNILFVGLPDGGSGEIWYDHVAASSPFLDPLLATDHAPYLGLVSPNLPYARDSVVEEVEALIRKYQPALIATPHPDAVGHIDHIVNNYFVVKALQALARQGAVRPDLPVLVNAVRNPKEQPFTPYHYKDVKFYVSGDAAALEQEAWWFYQSQGGNRAQGNIRPLDKLSRREEFRQLLDWNDHQGWNNKKPGSAH